MIQSEVRKVTDEQIDGLIQLSRKSGLVFSKFIRRGYKDWPHIVKIWNFLEKVESGEIKRGIITAPPQVGKSTTVSEIFPAWFYGRNPDKHIILGSYAKSLAQRFGGSIKSTIESEIYRDIFPEAEMSKDTRSKSEFKLTAGGEFIAAGVEGGITGHPADLIILDDTIKDAKQANSENYLKNLYEFYDHVIKTRIRNNTKLILMHTRWRENDLIGYLKKEHPEENWVELCLPAIDEQKNEALCEEIVSLEELRKRQKSNPMVFSSLYQQSPVIVGGNIIKSDWWQYYKLADKPKFFSKIISSWDLNGEKGANNDMTVGQVWGLVLGERPQDNRAYLLYEIREQSEFNGQIRMFAKLMAMEPRAYKKLVEAKSNGGPLVSILENKITGIERITPVGSKEERAIAVCPYIESKQVYLPDPSESPWVLDYVSEHSSFPNGDYDDRVDATSQALYYLFGPYQETFDSKQLMRMFS